MAVSPNRRHSEALEGPSLPTENLIVPEVKDAEDERVSDVAQKSLRTTINEGADFLFRAALILGGVYVMVSSSQQLWKACGPVLSTAIGVSYVCFPKWKNPADEQDQERDADLLAIRVFNTVIQLRDKFLDPECKLSHTDWATLIATPITLANPAFRSIVGAIATLQFLDYFLVSNSKSDPPPAD
jgi:hypothetical protein